LISGILSDISAYVVSLVGKIIEEIKKKKYLYRSFAAALASHLRRFN
jgi:recombinational DNA repair protein (RecF pathway)